MSYFTLVKIAKTIIMVQPLGGEATVNAYAKVNSAYKITSYWIFSIIRWLPLRRKKPIICMRFTTMNGVGYEFYPKLFYWDRTYGKLLFPSSDPSIKPNDLLYPKKTSTYTMKFYIDTLLLRLAGLNPFKKACVWNVDRSCFQRSILTITDVDTWRILAKWNRYTNCIWRKGRN
jgi:serine/threonine protein phosphatase 1